MCAYQCLLLSSAAQKPSTLELRSEFDIKDQTDYAIFRVCEEKPNIYLFKTLHSASFQRAENSKDGVMLLGVKSSVGEENGEPPSFYFLQQVPPDFPLFAHSSITW